MNDPKVSIVIGAYNCGRFIQETVNSVVRQTFTDWELVIVDDYSTDDTCKKIEEIRDERIRIIRLHENSGRPAVARNIGITASKGEFVAFLDHDDIWFPSKLARQIYHFQDKSIAAVGAQALSLRGHLTPRIYSGKGSKYDDYDYRDFMIKNHATCSAVLARKDILLDLKGFGESMDLRFIEDWELWIRIAQVGKFRILKEPLLFYRVPADKNHASLEVLERCFCMLDKHSASMKLTKNDINKIKSNINFKIAINLFRDSNPESRKYFIETIKCSPRFIAKLEACILFMFSILPGKLIKALLLIFFHIRKLTYVDREVRLKSVDILSEK